jgi:alpha-2-macroglobulin
MKKLIIFLACLCSISASLAQNDSKLQPRAVQIEPALDVPLPEQGVFALLLNRPLTGKPQALCDVWGIRSAVPVEHIIDSRRAAVLKAYRLDASNPLWTVLRCQTSFPDGAGVTLRWLNAERSGNREESSNDNWEGQAFSYKARSDLPVVVTCERTNASAGCNPLAPVQLAFSKLVLSTHAAKIVLKDKTGKRYLPLSTAMQEGVNFIEFKQLPPEETLTVVWPNELDEVPTMAAKAKPVGALSATKEMVGLGNKPLLSSDARNKAVLVRMGNYPPLVKFAASFGVAEKAIGAVVPITVRQVEASSEAGQVKLRQLRVNDEISIIELIQTLNRVTRNDDSVALFDSDESEGGEPVVKTSSSVMLRYPFAFPSAKNRNMPVDTRSISWLKHIKNATLQDLPKQLDGAAFEVLGVPLKESGLYVLEAESIFLGRSLLDRNRPMYVRSGALVTDLGVHMHLSDRSAALWITQLSTGKPVADAAITVYDCKAKKLLQGTSNAQGWLTLDGKMGNKRWDCPLYAFAKKGDDISFVQSNWQRGIESWRFEGLKNQDADVSNKAVHTVVARNLLKGGETLYAKHYWRTVNNRGELVTPRKSDLPSTVKLVHQGSNESVTLTVDWDARGNAQTVYKIPDGAKRGVYQMMLGTSDCFSDCGAQYRVEDFRLPILKSEVVSPKSTQFVGEKLNVMLRLNYLSGGAAAGESVAVAQRLLKHTPRFEAYDAYYFGMGYRWQDDLEDGFDSESDTKPDDTANTANKQDMEDKRYTLNANGTLVMSSSVKKSNGQPKVLLTEMEYRDPNGETYRAQGRTVIWPSAVVLGSKVDYWNAGSTRKVEFIALSPEGKPLANVPIEVQGAYQGYVTHRRRTVGGFYGYHSEKRDEALAPLCKGRSDIQGRYTCEFKPKLDGLDSGEFTVQATATDSFSRKSVAATSLWLYSGEEVWFSQGDHDRMDVLLDKVKFKVGETATLQVRSPFREATAWVNVMRSGVVIDTLVLPLTGKNPTITLPMKSNYEPNVFVNVLAVRGRTAEPAATALVDLARPAFKLGLVHLEVSGQSHELAVKVITDKSAYQSRETAIATVQVSPPPGKLLPAEREVTVFAIDEALLELLPNGTWDVLKGLLAQRGYGFETASMNMQVMGKRHYGRKALPAGGGGGKSAARELFETLLVWQGSVKLDASGKAVVNIPVNDSLTRFKVIAVANAGADLFGTGQTTFIATKDLQILSGLPISVREGDQLAAAFTLRNTTDKEMSVGAVATIGNQVMPVKTVHLLAGEAKTVSWLAQVPLDVKMLNWRVDAVSSDGKKDTIVIKQIVTPALTAARYTVGAQNVDASVTLPIKTPDNALSGKGELKVSLSPAFATDAASIRDYMRTYPFYCLEQRTSKAVSLRDPVLWGIISGTIDQYITDSGLVNYYPDQYGYDGGYDVLTSFVLSASHEAKFKLPEAAQKKMLQGLVQFVKGKLERHYDYYGSEDGYDLTERKLLALEALARHQAVPEALSESLKLGANDLPKLSNRAIVQWIDVLNRVDWPNKSAIQALAIDELNKRMVVGKDGLVLQPKSQDNRWYWMYSDDATAAKLALLALDTPALKTKAEGLARGALSTQRGGAHWWQTQANVWGSLMLDKRAGLAKSGLNGITQMVLGSQSFNHDWAKQPAGEVYTFTNLSAKSIQINHAGLGNPYATIYGTAWVDIVKGEAEKASVSKTIKPIKQAVSGRYSVGDVLEVQVRFSTENEMGWLAVTDPIPAGATVLGNGLKGLSQVQSIINEKKGRRNTDGSYEAYPAYVERTATVIRAYYEYLWGKNNTLTYQVRINNAGTFKLPPTQVEAMYDPNTFAYSINEVMVVK